MPATTPTNSFLRLRQVTTKTKLGRTTTLEQVKAGLWPPPIKLGARAVAWVEREIDEVLAARIAGASDVEIRALVRALVAVRARSAAK